MVRGRLVVISGGACFTWPRWRLQSHDTSTFDRKVGGRLRRVFAIRCADSVCEARICLRVPLLQIGSSPLEEQLRGWFFSCGGGGGHELGYGPVSPTTSDAVSCIDHLTAFGGGSVFRSKQETGICFPS